jgi:Putative amidoligase enzyme
MKVTGERYTIIIRESYSTFNQSNYTDIVDELHLIKAKNKSKDGRVSKDVKTRISQLRRMMRQDYSRVYRIKVLFKRSAIVLNFEIEHNPRVAKFTKLLQEYIKRELGRWRKHNREIIDTVTYFNDPRFGCKIIGHRWLKGTWVHAEAGQIYRIAMFRKLQDLYTTKLPVKKIRYIGIELEFCAPIEELDLALKLWNAGVHKFAQLKKDGSLRPKLELKEHGFELAMLLPERNYRMHLQQVCKILEQVGAKAEDRRCGLHVHLDMRRGRKKDIVYNNLVACQKVLLTFLDPHREDNEFCRTVESRKFPNKFVNTREERYKTINAVSYYKYRTLEVRMHQGSVNFKDIANWMDLLIKIGNHKSRIKRDVKELTELKKRIKIDHKMGEFFQDKVCYWQLSGPQQIRPRGAFASATETLRNLMAESIPPETPSRPQTVS